MPSFSAGFWRLIASIASIIYANKAEPALWLIGVILVEVVILFVLLNASTFL